MKTKKTCGTCGKTYGAHITKKDGKGIDHNALGHKFVRVWTKEEKAEIKKKAQIGLDKQYGIDLTEKEKKERKIRWPHRYKEGGFLLPPSVENID